ncbi:MAG TPA: hypothetical protein VN777_17200 [Terriglobales bacterium]|nr:hypothetical protein [Terriglobales bacterium]
MKMALLILLAAAALGVVAFLYHHHYGAASGGPVAHVRNEFEFTVHAPYRVAAPLFGPEGERGWAGRQWNPQFLYPQPALDSQGAVFTIRHGHHHAYWINTSFDTEARHFQYVYFIPDTMVVLIDVHFTELDPGNTKVNVAYERTALNPAANQHVQEMGNSDREGGKEWGTAIKDYLARQTAK